MLELRVRNGELEDDGQWVYAWIGPAGVVYVGATTLHPATRTWLHLHDESPEIGRLRDRYPKLASEELDVLAHELPAGVDRQQIRHGSVSALDEHGLLAERHVCDPALAADPHPETDRFVEAIEARLQ